MVWLTLVIGVLNLCLGYAAAVYLGYAPPGVRAAWEALAGQRDASTPGTQATLQELSSLPIDQMLDDEPEDTMDDSMAMETYEDPDEDDASALFSPDDPEAWELNEKYIETSVLKLNIAMLKSGKKTTEIDTRLRNCRGRTDRETIQECLADLKEDCETYLAEHSELAEKFSQRIGELGELSALGDEIEMANLEQSAQVETTLNNLKHMDFKSDLEQANARLLEEIANLRAARHKLRDNQEVAFLAIARQEDRMDKLEPRLFSDPLTRGHNRIGLEATLWQWWQEKRHQSRQISAALFDMDAFGELNEDYGPLVGDRILQHLAQIIREEAGKGDLVGRYAGQRFLIVTLDVGPRTAIKKAETIRQLIQQARFLVGGQGGAAQQIRVTAAGAIAEVSPEDSMEGFLDRLEETLKRAKQAGPNRSFSHDGTQPELVESPDFGVAQNEIQI